MPKRSHHIYDAVKRVLDIVVGTVALVVLSPLLLGVGIAVALRTGRPVIFAQERPGLGGAPFTMYKFRSMAPAPVDRSGSAAVATDAERLTTFGRRLRSSSLDELPELWNVIKGDMSLVGPRPLLVEYLEHYDARQARRHEVRPGITGWAQVNGRNAVSWPERLEMDVWYVENRSLWLDAKIIILTVAMVLRRTGVSAPGHATMEPFDSSPSPYRDDREKP